MKGKREPNALEGLIAAIIRREGPITLERYWDLALFHREHGYYARRDPFGRTGDFITAPEVSQMFGELLGAWMVAAWHTLGRPFPFVFAEMGPGRGTLMADMLRTIARLDVGFLKAGRIALVETSERLARIQAERLEAFDLPIRHVKRLEDIEAGPLLLVANELLDAVGIRQFVMTEEGWRERCVGVDEGGRLKFVLNSPALEANGRAEGRAVGSRLGKFAYPPGTILEVSTQRTAIADSIASRLAIHGGAVLMIDYGHAESGPGDTLQAMKDHAFADPLETPGECDITSHVDFAPLAERFEAAGLAVAPIMDQGEFLLRLGLIERAGVLGRGRSSAEQAEIDAAARRLAGTEEGQMGRLFKVLAAASAPMPLPPFRT